MLIDNLLKRVQIECLLAFAHSRISGVAGKEQEGTVIFNNRYVLKDAVQRGKELEEAIKDLNESGIDTKLVDYEEARWKKAVWNIPFNGMTVVLNTTTDKLMANSNTKKLIYEMMIEVIEAAQHAGVKNIDSSFADKTIDMTNAMPPYSPSMKLDYDFKRPMEIKYLYSRSIEEAKKNGYNMVKAAMLEKQLQFIESQYLK